MLKLGTKRRRTKQEISDEKEESRIKQESIESKLEAYEQLKVQHDALDESQRDDIAARFVLQDLLQKGKVVIADDGTFTVPDIVSAHSSKSRAGV